MQSFKTFRESFEQEKPPIHLNKSTGTLKYLAKTAKDHTMKFYISTSKDDANMYSGDSHYYTHHDLGARSSQIQGAITHHPTTDTYKYTAFHDIGNGRQEANHHRLKNMEAQGVTRGTWNPDQARVEESSAQ